jgi:lipopolysaccharide/colanic/teichoic acid biosynthesis glycosyltransferase
VLLFLVKQPVQFLQNIFSVLFGNKSWVGYDAAALKSDNYQFPKLRKGVLTPVDMHADKQLSEQTRTRLNLLYAKDYSLYKDLEIVWHNLKYLGRVSA